MNAGKIKDLAWRLYREADKTPRRWIQDRDLMDNEYFACPYCGQSVQAETPYCPMCGERVMNRREENE
jgi:predicted amidophosphoribosyltransferase